MTTHQEILTLLNDIENDDENIVNLQKAVDYYCSNYDICEGYKHALHITIKDQYNNHPKDQNEDKDMSKLKSILTSN